MKLFIFGLAFLFSGLIASVASAENQCNITEINGVSFDMCVLEKPDCYPRSMLPHPSVFATERGMRLVDITSIVFNETGEQGMLHTFLSSTQIEYWVFFPLRDEVCLMMEGFERV
jgi:hypothetical protein